MKKLIKNIMCLVVMLLPMVSLADKLSAEIHPLQPLGINSVQITDSFWQPKYQVWRNVTVNDVLDKFEESGALRNFDRVAGLLDGKHEGPPWFDGLIYETIRGASDLLVSSPDNKLKERLADYISHIVKAHQACPDGYLMTYTLLDEPEHRWGQNGGNLRWQHDVYNSGCLVEAGVHYYQATGETSLLEVAVKLAENMVNFMGPAPKQNIIPAHALPEEAFVSLYKLFSENADLANKLGVKDSGKQYLALVEFWIESRGIHTDDSRLNYGSYAQDHIPVFEQQTIEGHAVRATLMCAGLTACAEVNGRPEYVASAVRLWDNMVGKKMHITGGVGAYSDDEKFGPDYVLPNDAYLETCAAVGAGFYHHNMNMLMGDARYVDELERVLYNNVINGVSLSGNNYYYENPLVTTEHHRWRWHGCPCCPPMFLKAIGALHDYIYATDSQGLYVNLFIGSQVKFNWQGGQVNVSQETQYPWKGNVKINVEPTVSSEFKVFIRIPGWAKGQENPYGLYNSQLQGYKLSVNGKDVKIPVIIRGYAALSRKWVKGDTIELTLPVEPRRVYANKAVAADDGLVAIQAGPLVYCLEAMDNPDYKFMYLPQDSKLSVKWTPTLFGGANIITASAAVTGPGGIKQAPLKAIPFYCQDNRPEGGTLKVWVAESADKASQMTISGMATATASHCYSEDKIEAVNDNIEPVNSDDHSIPRHSWWDHKGSTEWLQYNFNNPVEISESLVYWWDDTPSGGGCTLPDSWSLEYLDSNENWQPVQAATSFPVMKDSYNTVKFSPIKTKGLRLSVKLKQDFSAGVLEWQVN